MKNIIVIGAGEVGRPIIQIEKEANNNVIPIDNNLLSPQTIPEVIDIMHICIPGDLPKFIKIAVEYITKYNPKLVIINSTVAPGTTKAIREITKVPTVHSYIRGVHPNLYQGIKTFVKYIGGYKEDSELAEKHFNSIGITTSIMKDAISCEMAKVLDTSYYTTCILWAKYCKQICDKYNLDYEEIYTDANKTYNDGYIELGMPQVVRPILYPPTGKIGGHCCSQNLELLPESRMKRFLKELNETQDLGE